MSDHVARLAAYPWRRCYGTVRWRKLARHRLTIGPLCRMCLSGGVVTAATVCDHVERHGGDPAKFWSGLSPSLNSKCHNSLKQRAEQGRKVQVLDADGWPRETWRGRSRGAV